MSDPRLEFELALVTTVAGATGVTWPVYNRAVTGRWEWDYILVEPGEAFEYPEKLPVYELEYQVAAISLSAGEAMAQAAALDDGIRGSLPTVAGHRTLWVDKVLNVDLSQALESGQKLWRVGGLYKFRLRAQP